MKTYSFFYKNRYGKAFLFLLAVFLLCEARGQQAPCPSLVGTSKSICFGDTNLESVFRVSGNRSNALIRWYRNDGTRDVLLANPNERDAVSLSVRNFDLVNAATFSQHPNGMVHEVKATQTYAGCSESAKQSVYVVQLPQLPVVGAPTSAAALNGMCNGNEISLRSDTPSDVSLNNLTLTTEILWGNVANATFSILTRKYNRPTASAQITLSPEQAPSASRIFNYVRQYRTAQITSLGVPFDVAACPTAASANIAITVWPRPIPLPNAPPHITPAVSMACPNEPITLTLNGGTDGSMKEWVRTFGDAPLSINNDPTEPLTQFLTVPGVYTYHIVFIKNNLNGLACDARTPLVTVTAVGIVTPPVDASVCVGGDASFSATIVIPAGNPPSASWEVDKGTGQFIADDTGVATRAEGACSLAVGGVTALYTNYRYRLVVRYGANCTVISDPVILTVKNLPSVTANLPPNSSVCRSSEFTLEVRGSGTGQVSCQWERKLTGESSYAGVGNPQLFPNTPVPPPLPQTTFHASLIVPAAEALDIINGAVYRATITANGCATQTAETTITLKRPPVLDAVSPPDAVVCVGESATFSVGETVVGEGTLVYRWFRLVNAVESEVGTNSTTYTTPLAALTDNGGGYFVRVTDDNRCSSSASRTALLTVNSSPSITGQPVNNVGRCDGGGEVSFTVAATGNGAMQYQWEEAAKATPGVFTAIPSSNPTAASATLTMSDVPQAKDGYKYRVVVSNGQCRVTSDAVTLNAFLTPGDLPLTPETCAGSNYHYALSNSSGGVLKYQWQNENTGEFVNMGEEGSHLDYEVVNPQATTRYRVMVRIDGTECRRPTAPSTLTVNALPVFTVEKAATCAGKDATFSATNIVGSSPFTYQWREGNAALSTENAFTLNRLRMEDNGRILTVTVTDAKTCSASRSETIAVTLAPTAAAAVTAACSGDKPAVVALSNPNAISGATYRWTLALPSTVTLTEDQSTEGQGPIRPLFTSTAAEDATATYTVTPWANGCDGEAIAVPITIHPHPTVQVTPDKTAVCTGHEVSIGLSAEPAALYTWRVNAPSEVIGWQNQTTAAIGPIRHTLESTSSKSENVVYTITPTVTSTGCAGQPVSTTIEVQSEVKIRPLPQSVTVCPGVQMALSAEATGSPALQYQWQRNGQNIANATAALFTTTVNEQDNEARFKVVITNPCHTIASDETVLIASPELVFGASEIKAEPPNPNYLDPVNFTYSGVGAGRADYSFNWDFGDNTVHSTFEDPMHNYAALGLKEAKLTATAPDNCRKTFALQITVRGSVPDIITADRVNQQGIQFYPIPLDDKLNISAGKQINAVSISTINGQRALYSSVNGNKTTLDTSTLTSGIYILSVETEEGMARFKVVK